MIAAGIWLFLGLALRWTSGCAYWNHICKQVAPGAVRALASSTSANAGSQEQQGANSKMHTLAALGGMLAGVFGATVAASANEVSDGLHSPHYPWPHEGPFDAYDHASIRRGHQVYQQVILQFLL
jgi:ubiquinol-cytochrome c reductase cytochrome c1 subunit